MKAIIEGNTITHRWPLNIEDVHEIEPEMMDIQPGDAAVYWDLGLPAVGYCWVLSAITVAFDLQPILPSLLWVDSLAGANDWWHSFVGQGPNPGILAATTANLHPVKFKFAPTLKFPVNQDIAINWLGGDPTVLFTIAWECWQELESV